MALPHHPRTFTEQEYLAFDRESDTKYEYLDGQVLAMTGASWNHNLICVNISTSLNQQLADKPCAVVAGDMHLKVATAHSFRYPDVMAICDEPQFLDERVDTIVNPALVFEVASPSTALIDRNEKLREYRQIATLQAYVLVSQSEARVEWYQRQGEDRWEYTEVTGLSEMVQLPPTLTLQLRDVYRKVRFDHAD